MNEIEQVHKNFSLLDYMPVGCCLLRQDLVVLFWNQCLEDWTKIPRTEIINTSISNHFPHLNQPKYQIRLQQVFRNGLPAVFSSQLHQSLITTQELSIQQTNVTAVPSLTEEEFYALIVIQDVTELTHRIQNYQTELKQRKLVEAELKRSNSDLEQFAYIASHDLQEPLRMVSSFTQLLAKRYGNKLDDEANQIIGFAVEGAMRMQALIRDLLTYSRVHSRGQVFKETDCQALLDIVVANLQILIKENKTQVDIAPLPSIRADETQLIQLFQNLITNSIKYRRAESPKIEIGATEQQHQWLFWVRDNGLGIETKQQKRIFLIFQRLHRRQDYSGTGIGLALCKKIVERHGGEIWVESEPGKGSTFYFTLLGQELD